MIKVNKGDVSIHGSVDLLMSELSVLIHHLHVVITEKVGEDRSKEILLDTVNDGFKTIDEIKEEVEAMMKKHPAGMSLALVMVLGELLEDLEEEMRDGSK